MAVFQIRIIILLVAFAVLVASGDLLRKFSDGDYQGLYDQVKSWPDDGFKRMILGLYVLVASSSLCIAWNFISSIFSAASNHINSPIGAFIDLIFAAAFAIPSVGNFKYIQELNDILENNALLKIGKFLSQKLTDSCNTSILELRIASFGGLGLAFMCSLVVAIILIRACNGKTYNRSQC